MFLDTDKQIPRWKIWEVIAAMIGIFAVMIVIGQLGVVLIETWGVNKLLVFFGANLIQTGLLIGISYFIVVNRHEHSVEDLGLVPDGLSSGLGRGIKWGLGLFFLVMVLGVLISIFYPVEPEPQDFAKILLLVDTPWKIIFPIIMGVVLAPLGEEIFFRGLLYPAFRKRMGVWGGIVLSALFFGGMHLDLYRLIPIAAGGAGLTYLYEKTGNIWTNIIAHAVWNAIMIALIFATFKQIG